MDDDPWTFPRLIDYWDQRQAAIDNGVKRIEALPEAAALSALQALEAAVTRHVAALDDDYLGLSAFIMSDDLYKAACVTGYWSDWLRAYLTATAGRFCSLLSARGLTLNYVVDNVYEQTLFGMAGPLEALPRWFQSAGFVYICPQAIALELMLAHDLPRDAFAEQLPRYAREAEDVAGLLVKRCHDESRHFVYLDADSSPESLEQALIKQRQPGHVVVFRNDPPFPGTTCSVWKPPGMRWPNDPA